MVSIFMLNKLSDIAFRHERHQNSMELSKYVWDAKCGNEDFTIAWSIADRAQAYSNKTKRCNLCLTEKLRIMSTDKDAHLNKRSELISTCRHANKFRLSNFVKPRTQISLRSMHSLTCSDYLDNYELNCSSHLHRHPSVMSHIPSSIRDSVVC